MKSPPYITYSTSHKQHPDLTLNASPCVCLPGPPAAVLRPRHGAEERRPAVADTGPGLPTGVALLLGSAGPRQGLSRSCPRKHTNSKPRTASVSVVRCSFLLTVVVRGSWVTIVNADSLPEGILTFTRSLTT